MPITSTSYWQLSRAPRYSLTFVLPLLAAYELAAAALQESTNGVRNGADVMLKSLVARVVGPAGPTYFAVALVIVLVALAIRDRRRNPGPLLPRVFAGMTAEAVALALAFGLVVGIATAQLVQALHLAGGATSVVGPRALAGGGALDRLGAPGAIMLSLGAGIYEELFFRVLLVGLLVLLGRRVMGWGPVAANTFAVVTGALIFSAFHYIGPFGDRLEAASFVFRALSGLAFSGLYVTRGFGITAWTHALYDIFLVLAR